MCFQLLLRKTRQSGKSWLELNRKSITSPDHQPLLPLILSMEAGQGPGTFCLSHFFLHQWAPLTSITCLVLLVSEFASLDLISCISSQPHHPTVSASHLASTPLILLSQLPVLDKTTYFILTHCRSAVLLLALPSDQISF